MKKEPIKDYNFEDESRVSNILREPTIEYGYQVETEMEILPPLTDEELADTITGDELREHMHQYIHELFKKK